MRKTDHGRKLPSLSNSPNSGSEFNISLAPGIKGLSLTSILYLLSSTIQISLTVETKSDSSDAKLRTKKNHIQVYQKKYYCRVAMRWNLEGKTCEKSSHCLLNPLSPEPLPIPAWR